MFVGRLIYFDFASLGRPPHAAPVNFTDPIHLDTPVLGTFSKTKKKNTHTYKHYHIYCIRRNRRVVTRGKTEGRIEGGSASVVIIIVVSGGVPMNFTILLAAGEHGRRIFTYVLHVRMYLFIFIITIIIIVLCCWV